MTKKTEINKTEVVVAKDEPPKLEGKSLAEIQAKINGLEQKDKSLSEEIKIVKSEQPIPNTLKSDLKPIYFSGSFVLIVVLVLFWIFLRKVKQLEATLSRLEAKSNVKSKLDVRDKKIMPDLDVIKKLEIIEREIKEIKEVNKVYENKITKRDDALRDIINRLNAPVKLQDDTASAKNLVTMHNQKSVKETNDDQAQLKTNKAVLSAINAMLQRRPTLNPATLPKHLVDNISNDEMQQHIKSMNLEFSLHYLDGASAPSNAELICFKLNNIAYVFPHYSSFNNPNLASWFDVLKDTQPFGIVKLAWVERNSENVITIHEKGTVNT